MEPHPERAEPSVDCPWQILRLRGKFLADEIRRHREELQQARGDRRRIVHLQQAERAAQRTLHALGRACYPAEAAVVRLKFDPSRGRAAPK